MRSIQEIYNALAVEKASMSELDAWVQSEGGTLDNASLLLSDLKGGSKVALWRLWLWLVAVGSWINEQLYYRHRQEVVDVFAQKRPHTLGWYGDQTRRYRDGVTMQWDGMRYIYPLTDTTAPLVSFASAVDGGDRVRIKCAKGAAGSLAPLTAGELARVATWWGKWKDAGVQVDAVSQPADLLKVNMKIIRDRLVLNNDNSLVRDSGKYPIDEAIATYAMNLQFDDSLRLSEFKAAILAAEGVVDVKLYGAWHKPSGGSYEAVEIAVTPESGYFVIDQLNSVIEYSDLVNVGIGTE